MTPRQWWPKSSRLRNEIGQVAPQGIGKGLEAGERDLSPIVLVCLDRADRDADSFGNPSLGIAAGVTSLNETRASLSVNFISAAAAAGDYSHRLQSRRRAIPVTGTRRVSKRHMLYNQANPHIAIDPRTADISINGQALPLVPTADLPLNRRYFLF